MINKYLDCQGYSVKFKNNRLNIQEYRWNIPIALFMRKYIY